MLLLEKIPCIKYNYSLEMKYQNSDHYKAALSFTDEFKHMRVDIFKPKGYKMVAQVNQER